MESRRISLQRLLRVLAAAVWAGIILFALSHRADFTLDSVLGYTPKSPLLAALVLLLLFALKSLSVVFYSGVLYAASGVLFPMPEAILINVLGTLVMASVSYALARGVGAGHADELRRRYPRLGFLEGIRSRNRLAFVIVLRCVGVVSFDVGSLYCGAVRMPFAPFLLGSVVGKAADVILLSVMGESLGRRSAAPFLLALGVDLALALAAALWIRKSEKKTVAGATGPAEERKST